MKITTVETLYANAGWRNLSFLKVGTDQDLIGWAEFPENHINDVLSPLVRHLGGQLIGEDPRRVQPLLDRLRRSTTGVPFGAVARAIGAIENALIDIKAKHLGVPAYELVGGMMRSEIRLYWSHCGSYHVTHWKELGVSPIRSLDDVVALGRRVRESGYSALKTNVMMFDRPEPYMYRPGYAGGSGDPDRNASETVIAAAVDLMAAFRQGAGTEIGLKLDVNFNFRPDGYLRLARALEPVGMSWLELDNFDARAVAQVRRGCRIPIASCEAVNGRRLLRPFLEEEAVDVVIIDVPWNGLYESMRMAALADSFEINVAPHNFCGPLATLINAHFCAAVPNFRVMEMDVVQLPWMNDLITHTPAIERGVMRLPAGPGWGAEVNEEALLAHPVLAKPH
jgi:L-alanine-DL-glutamate epimerase-like enolase superfamily enzyme